MKNKLIKVKNERYIIKRKLGKLNLSNKQIKELSKILKDNKILLHNKKNNEFFICEKIKNAEIIN